MEKLLASLRNIVPVRLADAIRPAYHYVLAVAGAVVYRFPGRRLTVIGITGTNGKSTTAYLAAAVLSAGGHQVASMTTVNFRIGNRTWPNETKMTSPGRFAVQRFLRRAVKAGCTHAVLEVSSHALHWHRVWGIPFRTAVFTNLSRDHLDLHKSMDEYRATKGKLFAALADSSGESVSIVNGDDPAAPYFLEFFADTKYVYGQTGRVADVMPLAHTVLAEDVVTIPSGSKFTARLEDVAIPITLRLSGSFNVCNALAAVAIGYAHNVHPKTISQAIDNVAGVPGRMERVEAGQPFMIVADYAHTPDAFDKVLSALREQTTGRLHAVFGATGDRDRGKRPDLGRVAAERADRLYLTEEDAGSEDPQAIIAEIVPGIAAAGKSPDDYQIIPDRREAIRAALRQAKRGDTVVLLAKGHETVMAYADGKRPWDDRQVAAEEWRKIASSS